MKRTLSALALMTMSALALAADRPFADPAQSLAGRYYKQFPNGLVTGEKYTGENILEVVPVARRAAYVRIHLDYYNGHSCGISGIASAREDALVYHAPETRPPGGRCELTVRRSGKFLSIDDKGGSCKGYCGARGGLTAVQLPYASKRPIRYLNRLRQSPQYREALDTWRNNTDSK